MLWNNTPCFSETVAETLLATYEGVQSLSCEIRKDSESPAGKMRMLSRIYFQKPDRLHVENFSPVKRRIVADGSAFYSYIDGDPKGFSRPIDQLSEEMIINLRKVPGTAMDHLLRLKGVAETNLDATADFPVRKAYDTGKIYAVLSLDSTGRLARLEMFTTAQRNEKLAQYDYSAYQEVLPGAWIPCLHQGLMNIKGVESRETVRVDNLVVNQPIAPSLFIAGPYFKDVDFVDSFEQIYGL